MEKKINFANNLKNLRLSANVTQKQLAEKLSVDQRTISAWENGVCEPSFTMLAKLCEIFNETFNDILT
ncbi:MAG: helix-turn-helix transcriptional regulator [Alphaproteobacteria bacterium]|nr:helix-turn-helix transcriptional regulator [Alphaproteobacteria bacterium]MBQ3234596.1 helix-turn-helix transcriptional regulator [Clostridia bacterium]